MEQNRKKLDSEFQRFQALTSLSATLLMRPNNILLIPRGDRENFVKTRNAFLTQTDKKILWTIFGIGTSHGVPTDFQSKVFKSCKDILFPDDIPSQTANTRVNEEDLHIKIFFMNIKQDTKGERTGLRRYLETITEFINSRVN